MTHYPAWMSLVVFSAAFAAVNLVAEEGYQPDIKWYQGWPFRWSEHASVPTLSNPPIYLPPQPIYRVSGSKIMWPALVIDLTIAVVVLFGATFQAAKMKAKLNLQAAFGITAIVAAGCLTIPYGGHFMVFCVNARTAALFMIPVAIGLACLSVLNLMGWVYGKLRQGGDSP